MNCGRHPERAAVARCAECGAGICEECYNETHWMGAETSWADGELCIDCYRDRLTDIREECRQSNKKRLKRLIISAILYILGLPFIGIGLYTALTTNSDGVIGGIAMIVFGVLFCGIYTGLTWRKAAKEENMAYERKHGANYVIDEEGIHKKADVTGIIIKVLFFIIGIALGVLWTPVRIITDAVNVKKDKKAIKNCEGILSRISAV